MAFFRLPSGIKTVLHPIISCALSANFSAVAYGYLSGSGMDAALGLEFHSISDSEFLQFQNSYITTATIAMTHNSLQTSG
jgi:hypothetical protein